MFEILSPTPLSQLAMKIASKSKYLSSNVIGVSKAEAGEATTRE